MRIGAGTGHCSRRPCPLAASIQGYELFHASAVAMDDRVVAFVAPSGTGKTSLATQLAASGWPLVTDDVLAVDARAGGVWAYRGAPLANIPAEQLLSLTASQRSRLGPTVAQSDKVHVRLDHSIPDPMPLGAVYFLTRSTRIDALEFVPGDPPDPRDLLAATFLAHMTAPERLLTQLDTCAAIAATVPVVRIRAPLSVSAAELAAALRRHARALLH